MIVSKIVNRLYRHRTYRVFERDLSEPVEPPGGDLDELRVQLATEQIVQELSWGSGKAGADRQAKIADAVGRGEMVFVAQRDRKAVYSHWLNFEEVWSHTGVFPLGSGWAYFSNSSAFDDRPDVSVVNATLAHGMRYASELGKNRALLFVYAGNEAVLNAMSDLEFNSLGDVVRTRLLNRFWLERIPENLWDHIAADA